jgi:hypothetical protein
MSAGIYALAQSYRERAKRLRERAPGAEYREVREDTEN